MMNKMVVVLLTVSSLGCTNIVNERDLKYLTENCETNGGFKTLDARPPFMCHGIFCQNGAQFIIEGCRDE